MAVTFHGVTNRSAQNNAGRRTYSVTFRLSTNDKNDGPFAVGSHPDLPVIGSLWPEDSTAYCQSLSVENSDPWRGWHVTANYTDERTYGTALGSGSSGGNPGSGTSSNPYKAEGGSTDPNYDEVLISWSGHTYEEVITNDATGNPIVNTALDPFSEPTTREVTDAICTINYRSTDGVPNEVLVLQNKTNAAAVEIDDRVFAARSLRMQNLTVGPREFRNGQSFRNVSYQLKYRSGRTFRSSGDVITDPSAGWDSLILSTGYSQIVEQNFDGNVLNVKTPCRNPDGTLVTEPAVLDQSGKQITVDGNDLADVQAQSHYLQYQLYETGDFTALKGVTAI